MRIELNCVILFSIINQENSEKNFLRVWNIFGFAKIEKPTFILSISENKSATVRRDSLHVLIHYQNHSIFFRISNNLMGTLWHLQILHGSDGGMILNVL